AGAGIAAGGRETGWVNDGADFDAELCRSRFHRCLDFGSCEILQTGERVANCLQTRLVFRRKIFGDALRIINDFFGEIETAVSRQFVKSIYLTLTCLERRMDI